MIITLASLQKLSWRYETLETITFPRIVEERDTKRTINPLQFCRVSIFSKHSTHKTMLRLVMCDVYYQTINKTQIIILHPLQHSNTVNRFSPLDLFTVLSLNSFHRECGERAGCPWAWWWHAWRGWRRGWCLRRGRWDRLRQHVAKQG